MLIYNIMLRAHDILLKILAHIILLVEPVFQVLYLIQQVLYLNLSILPVISVLSGAPIGFRVVAKHAA